jgi:hypothetical protein
MNSYIRKYMPLVLVALGLATASSGQSPVPINGTISDAGGNPATSGTVVFDIQPQSSSIHYTIPGLTTVAPQSVTCNIKPNGTLQNVLNSGPCVVWGNDLISPANTTYNVTFNPNNTNTNQVAQECISTPGPYNINNPVFCPVVSIIPQYSMITAPVIQGNVIPSTNGVFTFGNSQAYYANIYTHTITFLPSANGFLLATSGALSFTNTLPGGPFCPLSGCTFTGQIILPGGGTGSDAATVDQINAIVGNYCLLTGCTLTGPLGGTSASFSSNVEAFNYFVQGHLMRASDLSNGASGSGAVCLASGSACASSATVTSVGLSSSNTTLISVAGSPVTTAGTLAMTLNVAGTDTKFATTSASGTNGNVAVWDANGGLTDGSVKAVVIRTGSAAGCTTPVGTGLSCTTTVTWNAAFANTTYTAVCNGLPPFTGGSGSEPNSVNLIGTQNLTTTTVDAITVSKGSGQAASIGTITCIGVHL